MWYMYTTEYYSVIKKNKILLFATIWMDLEALCQVKCQTEKRSHLCVKPKNEQTTKQANKIPKFTDTENRFVAVRGGHGIWVKLVSVEKDYKFPVIE